MTRLLSLLCLSTLITLARASAPDAPFLQEVAEHHPLADEDSNDVRAVAIDAAGTPWIATGAGIFHLDAGSEKWRPNYTDGEEGPAFEAVADARGAVWIGAWDGLYRAASPEELVKTDGIDEPISVIAPIPGGGLYAFGPRGAWRVNAEGSVSPLALPIAKAVRAAAVRGSALWVATNFEVFRYEPADAPAGSFTETLRIPADPDAPQITAIAFDSAGALWEGGMGGVGGFRDAVRTTLLAPGKGLPNSDVRALAFAPDGALWIGTALGVARRSPDGAWSLRHGERWVLNDDIRRITFAPDGAAWIATGAGVSVIRSVPMTLAEKAETFLDICYARHIRKPGLVEKCRLPKRGDTSEWKPNDDDNDGQYTSMYLAMESYRYAATGDPEAREHARKAFHALQFLRTVAGDSGFVARTVVPSHWKRAHDANEEIHDTEWASQQVEEPRSKRTEIHWRLSDDGKWYWKCDTSSDEITGHFYGYLMFYDLAADENDRREIAAHVSAVIDHIIDGGYLLRDLDGEATRWGVWAPEKLNHDPLWAPDRGINSVEILSYLKACHHMTGNPRYKSEYLRLARDEGYAQNTRRAKTFNPSVRTHIDDELLALAWPGLFLADDDADLVAIYREGFEGWREANKMEKSPFFNFTYAAFGGGSDPTLDDSLFFLRDAPLDLVRWLIDNSRREDIALSRLPEFEHIQTSRLPPPSERGIIRWDDNPWIAVQGDGGRTESDGVYWLLPYWMGRYYGYINAK